MSYLRFYFLCGAIVMAASPATDNVYGSLTCAALFVAYLIASIRALNKESK